MRGTLRHFGKGALFCAALFAALFATMQAGRLRAQQSPQPPPPGQYLAPNQLDDLTAPIALYPDPLLSQILVASTYPLELVQVSQWLQRNPGLSGAAVTLEERSWDLACCVHPLLDVYREGEKIDVAEVSCGGCG